MSIKCKKHKHSGVPITMKLQKKGDKKVKVGGGKIISWQW